MRLDKHILSVILLVAALAYTLWFVFAGMGNLQDPLYWLHKYEQLEGGWMAVGTLLTGGLVVKWFGAELLPLRLVGWLCVVTAIGLPYCTLLTREQRRANLHWLALAYVLMGYGAFQEFSPGTLSVLLLSALWVNATKPSRFDLSNNRASKGLRTLNSQLSAVLLGLAVSVRFPNILALLVLIPLWRKRSLWNIPIAALTAGCVYLIGWWLVMPAPMDAAMTSHTLWNMCAKLWENGGKLLGYGLMGIGVLACSQLWRGKPWISGSLIGLAVGYFIACAMSPTQWYNTDMTYLVSALCLVVALATKQKRLYIGAALMAVAALGTDTAWLKLFPAALCLLPVAAVYFSEDGRRYLWTALAVVSIIVAIRMTTNSVGKTNLTKVQTITSVAPYKGIAIRDVEEEYMERIKADYDSLQDQRPILAVGTNLHLMRALTGCEAARYNEFWSNIFDSVYTAKYQPIIEQEQPIVFCFFSPQFKTKPTYRNRQSAFENMLRDEGYEEIDRSRYKYMIYVPSERMRVEWTNYQRLTTNDQ